MGSSFSLDPAVPMSEAVRRVASAEIDSAYAALAVPPDRHKGVHDARKCLKRLRSLLVLIRPGLPDPVYRKPHRAACAPSPGALRRPAMPPPCSTPSTSSSATPKDERRQRRSQPCAPGCKNAGRRPSAASKAAPPPTPCGACSRSGPPWPGSPSIPTISSSVAKGLRQSYRGGRKAFAQAFATGSDEDFHEWRKTLQHHWRHMQLLTPVLAVRAFDAGRDVARLVANPRRRSRHRPAATAGLGADHDRSRAPMITASFLKRCRSRQQGAAPGCRRRVARDCSPSGRGPSPSASKPIG